jgi:4-alpha-glucanotransferase
LGELPAISPKRLAGVTVPLFSLRTARSWGIGEIGDLPPFAQWMREAGFRLIQTLPLGEIAGGETSPYAALTAFGIDPMYISLVDVPDLGSDAQTLLDRTRLHRPEAREADSNAALLARARASRDVDYAAVRSLKLHAYRTAFGRFYEGELMRGTPRAAAFRGFTQLNEAWLADYALYRALKESQDGAPWWSFAEPLRERKPRALSEARVAFAREIVYYQYLQWIAHTQWYDARARLRAIGVEIMGDLPFMVGRDSADVWVHQGEFRYDASVGAPPDQFNEEGQDWGLPPYDWRTMQANDFAWLRRRCRYTASLYDRFRVDHLVGFYRTYMRDNARRVQPNGRLAEGYFDPQGEAAQVAHGERVLEAMIEAAREGCATLIAEDLGVVPVSVRRSLAKLGVPGYKVVIWEKEYDRGPNEFRDPRTFPALSVACFGTHDTVPVAAWWDGLSREERDGARRIPAMASRASELGDTFSPAVHAALMDALNGSGSDLVLFLLQDVLGTKERINTPATVGAHNWTYRLPRSLEELRQDPGLSVLIETMRKSTERSGR